MTEEREQLKGWCEECDEPILGKHEFTKTVKEDHFPNEPHISAEPQTRRTYECPECGYCPLD